VRITDQIFINLYIGHDFADVTGFKSGKTRAVVPPEYQDDIDAIRRECTSILVNNKVDEFSIKRDKTLFRVTAFANTDGKTVFMIRRPPGRVMEFSQLGFGDDAIRILLHPDLRGIVGIVGEMGSGKTTAAASTTKGRLEALGGLAVAIEDPPETDLDGVHGNGRCISVEARADTGGYKSAVKKAMRSGADLIYLGEVRDEDPAEQVVLGGNSGHLILTTWHAESHEDAIKRLIAMCPTAMREPEAMLASGLAAIVHVSLDERPVKTLTGTKMDKFLRYEILEVSGHREVQNIIRMRQFHQLNGAYEEQLAKRKNTRII